jgi:hypothetical protein
MAGGLAAWFQYSDDDLNFLTEGSNKLINQIKEYAEEAYVNMAGEWMEKAKTTDNSLLFYSDLTKKKSKKTKKTSPKKQEEAKEEIVEEAQEDKTEEVEDEAKKREDTKKKGQSSLESFFDK